MASIENNSSAPKRKAAAFVNVHVVSSSDETQKKSLGGLPLYADNPFHAALIKHIADGGELNIETGIHMVTGEVNFDF